MTRILVLSLLVVACSSASLAHAETPKTISCQGIYRYHLQGVAVEQNKNGQITALYWSFTDTIVKTDGHGKVLLKTAADSHQGDLVYHNGKIYVAVNQGRFNDPAGNAKNSIYVFDAENLKLLSKHPAPEVKHGAGGIAYRDGNFYVVGGLPKEIQENYIYQYDSQLKFVRRHVLPSGQTLLGIQTAAMADGKFYFGCYGNELLVADAKLKLLGKYDFDGGLGIIGLGEGKFLIARGGRLKDGRRTGRLLPAVADQSNGIVLQKP